jgi:hypothetical protein
MSIFKGILLQMRKEKGEKVQTFTISIGSRIAGSGFGLEIGRIARYCGVNRRGSGRQAETIKNFLYCSRRVDRAENFHSAATGITS